MRELILDGANGTSNIKIGNGLINNVAINCLDRFSPSRVHIVTDSNVAPLYLEKVKSQFSLPVTFTVMKAGEQYKRIEAVLSLYEDFMSAKLTRSDLVIALGGGVTGDVTGFAASTYLRGINLCQIPSTLLAQVDSSVGGKTGVDMAQGKNLVGAFYQPGLVLIDPQILDTLPAEIFADGMAEVIKYGCISNKEILSMVSEKDFKQNIENIIYECVKIKRDIVAVDEHDTGLRMILNFGHTIAHALEKLGNFVEPTHGQAVAIGMVAAMKLSHIMGAQNDMSDMLAEILRAHNLPTEIKGDRQQIFNALLSDKKNLGGTLNFILVRELGKAEIEKIPTDTLKTLIEKL